jgi:hypothetical protein
LRLHRGLLHRLTLLREIDLRSLSRLVKRRLTILFKPGENPGTKNGHATRVTGQIKALRGESLPALALKRTVGIVEDGISRINGTTGAI